MKKGIIGRKLGMTQLFCEDGALIPVTVIEAGPCTVSQVKTKETDGYEAVQMGFESVINCILVAVVPFNVIKGVVISIVTFLLYKRLSKLLHKLAGKKA